MTIDEYLKYCLELSHAATRGPWTAFYKSALALNDIEQRLGSEDDWKFIAEARSAVPLLIKLVEKQRETLSLILREIVLCASNDCTSHIYLGSPNIDRIKEVLAVNLTDLKKELES